MSPELEQLLAALYKRDTCEPADRGHCERTVGRLIEDALRQSPNLSRAQFLEAISDRYQEYKRIRKKQFPTLPPKAWQKRPAPRSSVFRFQVSSLIPCFAPFP